MWEVFKCQNLSSNIKHIHLRYYVFNVLFYRNKPWTLAKTQHISISKLLKCDFINKLNISWTDHITNQTVVDKIIKKKKLMTNTKIWMLEYMGHSIDLFRASHRTKLQIRYPTIQN